MYTLYSDDLCHDGGRTEESPPAGCHSEDTELSQAQEDTDNLERGEEVLGDWKREVTFADKERFEEKK